MNTNSSSEPDTFYIPADEQASGFLSIRDAPDISQEAWYDIEDEDETIYDVTKPSFNAQSVTEKQPVSAQQIINQATNVGSQTTLTHISPLEVLRRIISLRLVIILAMVVAMVGGAALAKHPIFFTVNHQEPLQSTASQQASISTSTTQPSAMPTSALGTVSPTPVSTAPASTLPAVQDLPAGWVDSGRNIVDATEAIAVAETFTQRYETLDYRSPATLTAARFLLTPEANIRFSATNKRSTKAFADQLQQQHLMQVATITGAKLIRAESSNGSFFAWVTVTYQLSVQQGTEASTVTDNSQLSVLLVSVPFNTPRDAPPMGGIGWLVSDFGKGNALPAIPVEP